MGRTRCHAKNTNHQHAVTWFGLTRSVLRCAVRPRVPQAQRSASRLQSRVTEEPASATDQRIAALEQIQYEGTARARRGCLVRIHLAASRLAGGWGCLVRRSATGLALGMDAVRMCSVSCTQRASPDRLSWALPAARGLHPLQPCTQHGARCASLGRPQGPKGSFSLRSASFAS